MTDERLQEIKALRAGITPAPWVADMTGGCLWHAASGGEIAMINWDHQTGDHQPGGDLEFIADAPLMVDDLLAEVERLRPLARIAERIHAEGFHQALRDALDDETLNLSPER